jgi:hypothetical protein
MIFEDDAYCFINFEEVPSKRARSYLALEKEINGETGRVVRFDSLSKIVSSGMRLGVLTGPVPVVQKVIRITENIKYPGTSPVSKKKFYALLTCWTAFNPHPPLSFSLCPYSATGAIPGFSNTAPQLPTSTDTGGTSSPPQQSGTSKGQRRGMSQQPACSFG